LNLSEDSLTIVKYALKGDYMFRVFDRFDAEDEPERLDIAIAWSQTMQDTHFGAYKELWIKTCPIFPTR
jgi:hypothetical protein